jgi:hypothetical protein
VDDPEDEDHTIFVDDVVHDAVIAHAESVEGVACPADRLHCLSLPRPGVAAERASRSS